ncbi:DnaJ domain-containing protein [Lentinula boryana]|uniref:DnaJ domain-containing protein n=1 Tax=Lentinula boryana TaxID=40481 RepID=A0ABQ8QQP3_9AGAR|nr:DnaJ domain-containing protein [Lentinula boryana]
MANHDVDSEPSEWRLPWWLKFLDKTNTTVTALTASFFLYTQSSGVAYFGSGAVACMIAVKIVKKMIRQERPVMQRPGKKRKKTYGMPSTHSTTITYYATYTLLASIYLPIHHTLPQSWMSRILPPLIVLPWATVIALSRIWLGHHTLAQVSVGCSFGFAFAWLWFYMWTNGLNKYGVDAEQMWHSHIDFVDLYTVLSASKTCKLEEIKKSYRRLALKYHPDKHATASESAKAEVSLKFQQVGFAYAVLSDEKRRKRYDQTGKTDEAFDLAAGEDGWEAYFEQMFDRATRGKLDEMKKEYQGSSEEASDLKAAYTETQGSIGDIMTFIPHSTHEDEVRFILILSDFISKGELYSLPKWESSIKDEKAKLVRQKQGEKEAKEAEKLAKELGVWDEFYGSGKTGKRKGKGKGKEDEGEEDVSALQALILSKKQKNTDSFFDSLAAKYTEPAAKIKGKGKKRAKAVDDEEPDESPKKRSKKAAPPPPDIDDAEFEKLQQKLFGDKAKGSVASVGKKGKGRKVK